MKGDIIPTIRQDSRGAKGLRLAVSEWCEPARENVVASLPEIRYLLPFPLQNYASRTDFYRSNVVIEGIAPDTVSHGVKA
jgi:hypothetical protein